MKNALIFILSIFFYSLTIGQQVASPFPYCESDNNPIGGGEGYLRTISYQDAHVFIEEFESAEEFKKIIEAAKDGDVIYIADGLVIDLTGLSTTININNGVTLSSGRGDQTGALIKTNDFIWYGNSASGNGQPMFTIKGDNVRITGLRFEGPFKEVGSAADGKIKFKPCIYALEYDELEVDNCEFYGWPYACVRIGGGVNQSSLENNFIHHNYFHDNKQNRLGYGVMMDNGYAKVFSNLFERNRHDIAGSGKANCGYEAFCNTILQGGVSHNFDMHAEGLDDGSQNAGSFIYIHHNDFQDVGGFKRIHGNDLNIMIRGRPDIQCRIENNRFAHKTYEKAIEQYNKKGGYGNLLIWNNIVHSTEIKGWFIYPQWKYNRTPNYILSYSSADEMMRGTKSEKCEYTFNYMFGDYDADGKTDIYKLENGVIYVIPFDCSNNGQNQKWKKVAETEHSFGDLQFGNFDRDQRTDILVTRNDTLYISRGQSPSWTAIRPFKRDLSDLLFADYNGDGITDMLLSSATSITISTSFGKSWELLVEGDFDGAELRRGYFNEDNAADILIENGGDHQVYYSINSEIKEHDEIKYKLRNISFGDFNHDGITDLIDPKDGKICIFGSGEWIRLNTFNFSFKRLKHFNF